MKRRTSAEWEAMYDRVHKGTDGVTVTFDYPDGPRTLVASGRIAAFDLARGRWGEDWRGEPCVSNPWSIYCDVTGRTQATHGQDLRSTGRSTAELVKSKRWRTGK